METILVFATSTGKAQSEMLSGVRAFAQGTDWNVQSFAFEGTDFPVRELLRFWKPAGCIVEGNGNGVTAKTIPPRAFGQTPVVYLGCDAAILPARATRVIHDASATARLAARELILRDAAHFAFVGLKGRAWSQRRQAAFADALRLNGRDFAALELPQPPSAAHRSTAEALKRWLLGLPKPCGLFAADDTLAEAILAICRQANLAVPDDLAVIGVDDNESICEHTIPTLTSVHPDFRQGGRFAARLLARKILRAKSVPDETVFAVSGLTRRGSTRIFKRKDADVAAALERLHAPDGARLTPHDVLAQFPCSRRNAEIRFRRATGRSVLDELMEVRLERAKDLLAHTRLPVAAIVEACGYRAPARLNRAFRAATGLTPLAWRHRSETSECAPDDP